MLAIHFLDKLFNGHEVSSLCQDTKHQLYFTIFTYLPVHLQFTTCRSNILHIWYQNLHKKLSLINTYCKYPIPEILYLFQLISTKEHVVMSLCQALGLHTTLNTLRDSTQAIITPLTFRQFSRCWLEIQTECPCKCIFHLFALESQFCFANMQLHELPTNAIAVYHSLVFL